ncbi:hypothetical protein [Tsukamurella paurometabola]|uniref:Uncharacterized protein n=1 Tax=Tsukamurella paurometabola TaxID=2061 RepID=A0ABS5NF05_TSUPA|nr:hypothetical protein [Tsukamurella paurometabola]MBS4102846.1 hypothetical protein [Tsukamurella paurometabola]
MVDFHGDVSYASVPKLAEQVIVGDRVWRHGEYWLVISIAAGDTATARGTLARIVTFDLRNSVGHRRTWSYRSDFDLAVRGPRRHARPQ